MISRRLILASSFALLGGCAARTIAPAVAAPATPPAGGGSAPTVPITPPGVVASVGPHASWNYATGGNGTSYADAPRTKAKVVGRFLTPSRQCRSSDLQVLVKADAIGGIAYVEFMGGLATTRVMGEIGVDRVGGDGVTKRVRCHAVSLNIGAFRAIRGAGGVIQVYARVVPVDTTNVQERIIGPILVYPEASETDGVYNIRLDGAGGAKTSIKAAVDQARTDGKIRPTFNIDQTGFYEAQDTTASLPYVGGTAGYAILTHSSGVVATIGRASMNTLSAASWDWKFGWNQVEVRGPGIQFDYRNFARIRVALNQGDGKPWWLNGCKGDNSIGHRDNNYINKGTHPGFTVTESSYFTDCDFKKTAGTYAFCLMVAFSKSTDTIGDLYSGTTTIFGNVDKNCSSRKNSSFFPAANDLQNTGGPGGYYPAATIRYTAGNGPATIRKTQQNGGGTLYLKDPASPTVEVAFPLGALDNPLDFAALAAQINARPGWSMSVSNNSYPARYMVSDGSYGGGGSNGFNEADATVSRSLLVTFDIHGDWFQSYAGYENFMCQNNTLAGPDNNLSQLFRMDGPLLDASIVNNIFLPQQAGPWEFVPDRLKHIRAVHNTTMVPVLLYAASSSPTMMQCLNTSGYSIGGSFPSSNATEVRGFLASAGGVPGPSNGSLYSGNRQSSWGTSTPALWLVNALSDIFKPTLGGPFLTTLVVPVEPYDIYDNLRTPGGDAIGAVSKNAA